jgi:hypothetical protein
MIGATKRSFVRNCSIHHSFNRAVTLHGVHHLRVEHNVAYDSLGHTFFIEDGIETKNRLIGNLGLVTRASGALLMSDATPATFWITNPDNVFVGNAAAGSERYGFWFDLALHPGGASATVAVCPRSTPLGAFRDNRAHSNGRYGLRVFTTFVPLRHACASALGESKGGHSSVHGLPVLDHAANPAVPARFVNLHAYKNGRCGAIATVLGALVFEGFRLADHRRAGIEVQLVEAPKGQARTEDALIIGHSPNQQEPLVPASVHGEVSIFAFVGPRKENYTVANATVVNFDRAMMSAFGACSHCSFLTTQDQGARTTRFVATRYENAPLLSSWSFPWRAIFFDADGSQTGAGQPSFASPYHSHTHIPGVCEPAARWSHGVTCNASDARLHRFTVGEFPKGSQLMGAFLMLRRTPLRPVVTVAAGAERADFGVCLARRAVVAARQAMGEAVQDSDFKAQDGGPRCQLGVRAKARARGDNSVLSRLEPRTVAAGEPALFRVVGTGVDECARVGSVVLDEWVAGRDAVQPGDEVRFVRSSGSCDGAAAAAGGTVSAHGTVNATLGGAGFGAVPMLTRQDPSMGWCTPVAATRAGGTVEAHFAKLGGAIDFEAVTLELTHEALGLEAGGFYSYVRFNYTEPRARFEAYYVTRTTDGTGPRRLALPAGENPIVSRWVLPRPPAPSGSILHNATARTVTVLFSDQGAQHPVRLRGFVCPLEGCATSATMSGGREPFVRRWSNASQWPNGTLPAAASALSIPAAWTLELDMDPPALGQVLIEGELRFDAQRPTSRLEAGSILVAKGGMLRAGTRQTPFGGAVRLVLRGGRGAARVGVREWLGVAGKALVVAGGELQLHGVPRAHSFVKLGAPADRNASAIEVEGYVGDWRTGEELVITSTDFDSEQAERRVIAGVSGTRIALDRPLLHYHHGGAAAGLETEHGRTVDLRAEVALVGRSITVEGSETADGFGGHLRVTSSLALAGEQRATAALGVAALSWVGVRGFGQRYTARAGLHFDAGTNWTASSVHGCSASNSHNHALETHREATAAFSITDNAAIDTTDGSSFALGGAVRAERNIAAGVAVSGHAHVDNDLGASAIFANFDLRGSSAALRDNVAAGSSLYGFVLTADTCAPGGRLRSSAQRSAVTGSVVHSARVGVWIYSGGWCSSLQGGWLIHKAFDYGIVFHRHAARFLLASVTLADCTVALSINPVSTSAWARVLIDDAVIIGASANGGCGHGAPSSPPLSRCRARYPSFAPVSPALPLHRKLGCAGRIGIIASVPNGLPGLGGFYKYFPPIGPYMPVHP